MKRILLLLAMLVGLGGAAFGQGNTVTISFPGVPTGGCAFVMFAVNASTGDLYDCLAGSWHPAGTSTGTGTVTSFSSGNLSPLFTTSVANASTTPALSFSLSTAGAHKTFMNNTGSTAAPGFQSIGTADLPAVTVFSNQANTYSTGLQSFASATMALPAAAAYAPTTAGLFGYDTTNNRLVFGNGTTTGIPLWLTSAPTNGQCAQFSGTTGLVVSAACGGVTSFSGDGTVITNSGSTGAVTVTIAGTSGGIPYFSSSSGWASSLALTANAVVIGGGAATAPKTISADTTTTHALFATAGAPAFRAIVTGDLPTVAIAQGGTGQTSASAAFNALAPATSTGGLIVGTGTNTYGNVAVGTAGQCLIVSGGTWAPGSCATGSIGGTGTANTVAKFTASATIGNSLLTDNATTLAYSGTGGLNLSAGPLVMTQIVAPTGSAGSSWLWADSTALRLQMKNGSNTAVNVVASGVDINTSDQVTATHLSAALPVNQGGTGTASTLTGLVRGGSPLTAAELSGDATTSGSNVVSVVATHLTVPLPTAQGGTAQNSTATFPTSGTVAVGGTCTNQAVTATSGSGVTCTTLTSAYVDTSIALTGTDINTSNQVTATHLASPLPSAQGGTANAFFTVSGPATSAKTFTFPNASATVLTTNALVTVAQGGTGAGTLTGIVRGSGTSALTASELSGDATTSGSNVVTVVNINGNSVPSGAAANQTLVATAASTLAWETISDCHGSSNALNFTQSTHLFSCLSIATLSNPMTTLGDMISGGAAGAVARLAGPTSGNSSYILTSTPSGGVATAPAWNVAGVPVHATSSATYTIQNDAQSTPDRASAVQTTNNTTSTAVTVPQAGSASMLSNFPFVHINTGSVVATDTPTTSTVNSNTTLKLVGAVSGHNPEAAFWWSDATSGTGNWWAAEILPTDANGRLGCEGLMALTGDVTNTAGSCATTVGAINGTAFSGTSGHLVSFGAGNTPADSTIVAANVVTAASTLTSTAIMTGGGSKAAQTACATCTLSSGGALQLAVGGSIGSADTGSPTLTFGTSKATFNQPFYFATTSNQIILGTSTNLTTLTFPASSGAVTLTFPNTTEYMVGSNSDTTTTHILHATAVAGVGSFSALACADLPALTGDATTSAGSCATTVAKINGTAFSGTLNDVVAFGSGGNIPLDTNILYTNLVTAASNFSSGGLVYAAASNKTTTSSADWAISTHTLTGGASAILDFHSASATAGFLPPSAAGAAPTTAGVEAFDTTANVPVFGNGSATGKTAAYNLTNTWSALQTFGSNASIASTAHGVLLSENTSAVVATAAGTAGYPLTSGGASADPSFTAPGTLATVTVTVDTSTPVTVSGTNLSTYHFNENATAATAVTYNLPTAAAGIQKCFTNAYNGTAANTGVLTIATSATGQFIIFTDGTLSATGGNVTSGGAAHDAACVVGVDSTHWQLYVQSGTWTKH